MSSSLFAYAKAEGPNDQPLLTAARVALEANPTPRMIRFIVEQDGTPIEITQPGLDPQPPQEQ